MRVRWYSALSSLNWFHNGKWNGVYVQSPTWAYPAGFLLFLLPAMLALLPQNKWTARYLSPGADREKSVLLVLIWMLPMAVIVALSAMLRMQFDVRYIVFVLGFYYILVAQGIVSMRSKAIQAVFLVVLVSYSIASLRANYFIPYKTDYRGASSYVASVYQKGDCACLEPGRLYDGQPAFWQVLERDRRDVEWRTLEQVEASPADCRRVWLVYDHVWFRNLDATRYERALARMESAYSEARRERLFGIEVIQYQLSPASEAAQ